MGLVLRCAARLRSRMCTEGNSASDGRYSTIDDRGNADDNGRGLV